MKVSRNKVAVTVLAGIVLVLFIATVAGLFYYREMIKKLGEVHEEEFTEYPRLYAYIAEDPDSQLSNRIYKEIAEYAVENDCYVEMTGQRGFSRVTAGFSRYDGEFRMPLVLAQASPIFHSSCEGKLGIALE